MTIPTQASVDSWRATVARQLDLVRAGLLDLIDCGADDRVTRVREPGSRDLEATRRAPSGQDHRNGDLFDPTPRAAGRRSPGQRSDPTGRAVEAWESAVQDAVLTLYGTVTAVDGVLGALGLAVFDEAGDGLSAPREPETRLSKRTGRPLVIEHPRLCRLATLDACTWLGAAIDVLADRMRGVTDSLVGERLTDEGRLVETLLTRQAREYADDRVTVCQAGCRHLAGTDGWCDVHRPRRCTSPWDCRRPAASGRTVCEGCKRRATRERNAA